MASLVSSAPPAPLARGNHPAASASVGRASHPHATSAPTTPPHGSPHIVPACCSHTQPEAPAAAAAAANCCPGVALRPLEGEALGCEVLGLDLMAHPITPQLVAALRQALLDHQVLVFRGQEALTPERHIEFSRHFGGLYQHVIGEFRLEGHEEIVVVSNEVGADGKVRGLNGVEESASKTGKRHFWHSDLSYMPAPPMGSMLHLKVRPPSGDGDTHFANMYAAYDALDAEQQRGLRELRARHYFLKNADAEAIRQATLEQPDMIHMAPEVVHPVVRTHPETGKRALMVSEGFTTAIDGWAPGPSEALLQRLYAHCTQPAFVYQHKWREGDMVFWDNRCTLHLATGSREPRTLYRTTIKGGDVF